MKSRRHYAGHYLLEYGSRLESAKYIKKKQFRDDLREAQMAHIDLTQLERVHTKASSKIKRFRKVGLSETHALGNREASTQND